MAVDDGGPAFPLQRVGSFGRGDAANEGMSLRDYFAGQALAGWLGSFGADHEEDEVEGQTVAAFAYRIADAMLCERSKRQLQPSDFS